MAAIVVVGLAVAVVVGTVLMAAAFYDVAFAGPPAAVSKCGCSGCDGCENGVPTREAWAIASLVQRSLPTGEAERIRDWTRRQPRVASDKAACPLMNDDGSCIVFSQLSSTETVL